MMGDFLTFGEFLKIVKKFKNKNSVKSKFVHHFSILYKRLSFTHGVNFDCVLKLKNILIFISFKNYVLS